MFTDTIYAHNRNFAKLFELNNALYSALKLSRRGAYSRSAWMFCSRFSAVVAAAGDEAATACWVPGPEVTAFEL